MKAIKGNVQKQHFKHHVKPNSTEKKCTYRDETYRHKLAKELVQVLKKIKVPAVYKYDSGNKSNQALLIRESRFIEANEILIERHIYENENGEIEIIHKKDQSKELLIKPDAIFLDTNQKPILIIEFVATHKPDVNKLIKLKRLGIDAVQVSIPKSSPEEIEKSFSITKHTKWLFNNEESNTNYLQFSNQYSGAIFEVDQEQRKLLEEGYKCRSAEIGDLIRTIERLLETEQYKSIERNFRSEILRVEKNTEREESELEKLCTKYSQSGIEQHYTRRKKLRDSETDLERRYSAKKAELSEQDRNIEQEIAEFEYQSTEVIQRGNSISDDIERERKATERIRSELTRLGARKVDYTKSKQLEFEQDKRSIELDIGRIQSETRGLQGEFESNRIKFENKYRTLGENLQEGILREQEQSDRLREQFESKFAIDKEHLLHELAKGEGSRDGGITQEYRRIHEFTTAILVYKKALDSNIRAREGYG